MVRFLAQSRKPDPHAQGGSGLRDYLGVLGLRNRGLQPPQPPPWIRPWASYWFNRRGTNEIQAKFYSTSLWGRDYTIHVFDGPPKRFRPAFKTSTLSSGMLGYMVAHNILMDGQGFPFLASRRARPIFRMRIRQREKSPTKILRNQGLEKPEICEKLRVITRDKVS